MINNFKDKRYEWLSNMDPCIVDLDGVQYPSVENAYQAAKTLSEAERVPFVSYGPYEAKTKGYGVTMRANWNKVKVQVMHDLVCQKFSSKNPDLLQRLLATGDEELVEGNWWHDTFWGVCNGNCKYKCGGGVGENHLGKLLMERRKELRGENMSLPKMLLAAGTVGFVGSRACTEEQLKRLGIVAGWAASAGKLGVSGGCEGADQTAANKFVQYGVPGNFHVHMPWPSYCQKHQVPDGCTWDCWDDRYNRVPNMVVPAEVKSDALWLASLHNKHMTGKYPALFGRNALIVLGSDVLVYAINGDSTGTTHDINIANDIGVPVINVSSDEVWKELLSFLKEEKARLSKEVM